MLEFCFPSVRSGRNTANETTTAALGTMSEIYKKLHNSGCVFSLHRENELTIEAFSQTAGELKTRSHRGLRVDASASEFLFAFLNRGCIRPHVCSDTLLLWPQQENCYSSAMQRVDATQTRDALGVARSLRKRPIHVTNVPNTFRFLRNRFPHHPKHQPDPHWRLRQWRRFLQRI